MAAAARQRKNQRHEVWIVLRSEVCRRKESFEEESLSLLHKGADVFRSLSVERESGNNISR
jgi:hypothetical protein